jgi:hypothetical protein
METDLEMEMEMVLASVLESVPALELESESVSG